MAEFQIIYGRKDLPKEQWRKLAHKGVDIWGSPQEANVACKEINENFKKLGEPYAAMLQRMPDPVDYVVREASRDGYQPFEIQGQEHHCAELTTEGNISYYNTLYDAYDDRRSTMKVGRYLRRYTEKTDNEISDICARYGFEFGDVMVHFAKTREEIKHVYEHGPRSCMGCEADCFELGGIHPAEAYASGDFEIAYITRDDRITARTVVIPSKKLYVCIYGDSGRLTPALHELGYKANEYSDRDSLLGLKFLKIEHGSKLAAPYLDFSGYYGYSEDRKYLVVARDGGSGSEEGYIYDDLSNAYEEDNYDYDDY